MYRRPLAVTFVGWILCILGVLSGLDVFWLMFRLMSANGSPFMMLGNVPIYAVTQFGIIALYAVSTCACGVFVLKGANWARWLYPICFAGMFVFLQVTSRDKLNMIPTLMVQAAPCAFPLPPKGE